jgi:2-keto-myo-inositol isomerase
LRWSGGLRLSKLSGEQQSIEARQQESKWEGVTVPQPIAFALNHITSPRLRFADFLRLAGKVGISAVEIRNDMAGVEIKDGTPAPEVRREAEAVGIEILSINALQRFNDWSPARSREASALAGYARDCGAKALVMCPVNSQEDRRSEQQRADDLRRSLTALMPILSEHAIIGLVEPLGFEESSLHSKRAAVEAITDVGGTSTFKLLHDTFHHYLAGEDEFFPGQTGLVHISGVEDAGLAREAIRDAHRVLVGPADLMDNVGQIRALLDGGYRGPFSFEPFSESVHAMPDLAATLHESIAFVSAGCTPAP